MASNKLVIIEDTALQEGKQMEWSIRAEKEINSPRHQLEKAFCHICCLAFNRYPEPTPSTSTNTSKKIKNEIPLINRLLFSLPLLTIYFVKALQSHPFLSGPPSTKYPHPSVIWSLNDRNYQTAFLKGILLTSNSCKLDSSAHYL